MNVIDKHFEITRTEISKIREAITSVGGWAIHIPSDKFEIIERIFEFLPQEVEKISVWFGNDNSVPFRFVINGKCYSYDAYGTKWKGVFVQTFNNAHSVTFKDGEKTTLPDKGYIVKENR